MNNNYTIPENYKLNNFLSKKLATFLIVSGGILMLAALVLAMLMGGGAHIGMVDGKALKLAAGDGGRGVSLLGRYFHAYLFSFVFYMAIVLGCIFFVVLQSLSKAGWSVTVRRIPEVYAKNIFLMFFLSIPILAFGMHDLYHWTDAAAVAGDALLQAKEPYLNTVFFIVRVALYFLVFFGIVFFFCGRSLEQDKTGNRELTIKMQRLSPIATLLFALSLTFFSFDFLMSLMPHWYSTIWGVYYFASCVVLGLCVITLTLMLLRRNGFLIREVNVEHYHDLGKLTFAFNVFWSYIAFSQYMLIWYANIPETTVFFLDRINGNWLNLSVLLVVGHVLVPIVLFVSRNAKRNLGFHAAICCLLIAMEVVNFYWIVMPNIDKLGFDVTLSDRFTFLGMGLLFFGIFFLNLGKNSILPHRDPRLKEAMHFENA